MTRRIAQHYDFKAGQLALFFWRDGVCAFGLRVALRALTCAAEFVFDANTTCMYYLPRAKLSFCMSRAITEKPPVGNGTVQKVSHMGLAPLVG